MKKRRSPASDRKQVRVAGYVRVSSQRQASEGDSLPSQQLQIEQEVEYRKVRDS